MLNERAIWEKCEKSRESQGRPRNTRYH
jgi:hypothetical protein